MSLDNQTAKKLKQIQDVEVVFPVGMWESVQNYLLCDLTREYACYLLCGHHRTHDGRLRLLVCYVAIPDEIDYESQSIASVAISQDYLISLLSECKRLGLSLIDVHSHPFSPGRVEFSGTDEADEIEKSAWFTENLPNCYYGSLLIGPTHHRGRLRSKDGMNVRTDFRIVDLSNPIVGRNSNPRTPVQNIEDTFDRQVRAFGKQGQNALGSLRVTLVGLGGLGSAIAVALAHLGVQDFLLIDHDSVDRTNINRLSGMRFSDIRTMSKKTDVAKRSIKDINPAAKVRTRYIPVTQGRAWRRMIETDLIFVTTDNHASRLFTNSICEQYLIPQISAGSLIESDGVLVESCCGHVKTVLPGLRQGCMLCSGIINPTEVYYERQPRKSRQEAHRRGYITNFDEPTPSVVHLNGVLANLAVVELHKLSSGFGDVFPYLFYDLLEQEILKINQTDLQCVLCSPNGTLFGRGDLLDPSNIYSEILP